MADIGLEHTNGTTAKWMGRVAIAGAISGSRSALGPALAAQALANDFDPPPQEFAQRAFRSKPARIALGALALAEMAFDKMPFAPRRIAWPVLVGRALSGWTAGALLAPRGDRRAIYAGAAIGAAAAIGGAFLTYGLRKVAAERVPSPLAGIVEDALVLGVGRQLIAR